VRRGDDCSPVSVRPGLNGTSTVQPLTVTPALVAPDGRSAMACFVQPPIVR